MHRALAQADFAVRSPNRVQELLRELAPHEWRGLLADLKPPVMLGVDRVLRAKDEDGMRELVIGSDEADPSHAIEALAQRSSAPLVKPVDAECLVAKLREAVETARVRREERASTLRFRAALNALTESEGEVALLMDAGLTNQGLGDRLGNRQRTVAIHRHA